MALIGTDAGLKPLNMSICRMEGNSNAYEAFERQLNDFLRTTDEKTIEDVLLSTIANANIGVRRARFAIECAVINRSGKITGDVVRAKVFGSRQSMVKVQELANDWFQLKNNWTPYKSFYETATGLQGSSSDSEHVESTVRDRVCVLFYKINPASADSFLHDFGTEAPEEPTPETEE